jgi:outer membrane protein TolC
MLKRIASGLILLLCASPSGYGQLVFNNLDEMWQYANSHNVAIKNAGTELRKGEKTVTQSYLDILPDINATGTYTDNLNIQTTFIPAVIFGGPEGVYRAVQFGQKYAYNAGFTAQLDILNLQTWYNVKIARETAALNKASLANTRRNTWQQLAGQYYGYILNRHAVDIAELSTRVADSLLASVKNKYDEGVASLPNVDAAKLNSERARQTLITASYQMRTTLNALKALLGLSVSDSVVVKEQFIWRVQTKMMSSPFTEDPSVSLSARQVSLNNARLKASNVAAYPTISIVYSNSTQQFDNTFRPFDNAGPQWFPATYWSLRASWSVFNGGNRWLLSQKNKLSWMQSREEAAQAKRQADINDENLRLNFEKAADLYKNAMNIKDLAYQNYQHTSLRHEAGLASLDDRLKAYSDFISYENQYLNSLSDLLIQTYTVKLRTQNFQ